jgi:hypothetical protein
VTVISAAIGRNAHSIDAMIRVRARRTALGCGCPVFLQGREIRWLPRS